MPRDSNNNCNYEFKRGSKKGTICGIPCQDLRCHDHCEKRRKTKAQYYNNTKKNEMLKNIEEEEDYKKLPNINDLRLKILSKKDSMANIYNEIHSIDLAMGKVLALD